MSEPALEFAPPRGTWRRRFLFQLAIVSYLVVFIGTAIWFYWEHSRQNPILSEWAILPLAVLLLILALALLWLRPVFLVRPMIVEDGVLRLPRSVPLASGRRTREILLSTIEKVSLTRTEGLLSAEVSLREGSSVTIQGTDLGPDGRRFLRELKSAIANEDREGSARNQETTEAVTSLEDSPEYTPPRRSWGMSVLLVFIAVLLAATAAIWVGGSPKPGAEAATAFVLVVTGGLALIAIYAALNERPVTLRGGTLRLGFPLERGGGVRSREVRLSEIVDVVPALEGEDDGVWICLLDEARFFLPRYRFRGEGFAILTQLCEAFGKSYADPIKAQLVEGEIYGFSTVETRGFTNSTLVLRKSVRTNSLDKRSMIEPKEVESIERVSTTYAGSGFLLTLQDGTFLMIRDDDVFASAVTENSAWERLLEEDGTERDGAD